MGFCNEWSINESISEKEADKLKKYHNKKGGLVFTEFNTTWGLKGKLRALDAIRFPDLETGIYKAMDNYPKISELIKEYPVELIEVHKWGFHVFGQLVGKSEIVRKYWRPKEYKNVILTLDSSLFHPEDNPDPTTEEIFEDFNIIIYTPKEISN